MRGLIHILISAVAVFAAAYILPGVHVASFWTALVVAVILGVVNLLVKPLIVILTLPVTIVTLGLFLFVINAAIILLVAWLVPGFKVDGFWWALIYSVVLSIISGVLHAVTAKLG
jgi:putative membrane protein